MLDFVIDLYIMFFITVGFLASAWVIRSAIYIVMEDIEDKKHVR